MSKVVIGVDYGLSRNDIPMYSVSKYENGKVKFLDVGKLEEFDYRNYVGSEHQVVGSPEDLRKFKDQFIKSKLR